MTQAKRNTISVKRNTIYFEIYSFASERAIADTLSRSIILDMCNVGYIEINGKKFNLEDKRKELERF